MCAAPCVECAVLARGSSRAGHDALGCHTSNCGLLVYDASVRPYMLTEAEDDRGVLYSCSKETNACRGAEGATRGQGKHWLKRASDIVNSCFAVVNMRRSSSQRGSDDLDLSGDERASMLFDLCRTELGPKSEASQTALASLLAEGVDPNHADDEGVTPLFWAAREGNVAACTLLLDRKANVDALDEFRSTPLFWAAHNGRTNVMELLLARKAEVSSKNAGGWTALHRAARAEDGMGAVRMLLSNGAQVEVPSGDNYTPLIVAAQAGRKDIVELLLNRGGKVNTRTKSKGWTALSWAARNGHLGIVKILLSRHASVDSQNEDGYTASVWAAKNSHREISRELMHRRADINLATRQGYVPLHFYASSGDLKLVKELVKKKADVNLQNDEARTAVVLAKELGKRDVVAFLEPLSHMK